MIKVTCAIIRNEENDVLVVQRGEKSDHPFKWEFPGGKLKDNETEEESVIREIREELAIDIVILRKTHPVEYDYGIKEILLIPFVCDTLDELPLLSEHVAFMWVNPGKLRSIDFSEADIIVAENYLSEFHKDNKTAEPDSVPVPDESVDEELKGMIERMMSKKEVDWIATSAIDNPVILKKLLGYSFSGDKKLAFHSSWTLTKVCDKYPEIINPYLQEIVRKLDDIDNESAQRSFLRILSFADISLLSENDQGILADHCFNALKSGFSAIAIKAYSMEILYHLTQKYPELANELSATIHMIQGEGSAGIVARGMMILKKLAEMPSNPGSIQS
jgi:8-oxo-dGTP diphosphatase